VARDAERRARAALDDVLAAHTALHDAYAATTDTPCGSLLASIPTCPAKESMCRPRQGGELHATPGVVHQLHFAGRECSRS
jgi:hypothetical protein